MLFNVGLLAHLSLGLFARARLLARQRRRLGLDLGARLAILRTRLLLLLLRRLAFGLLALAPGAPMLTDWPKRSLASFS
ncbi:MAG: hypothetical protein WCR74_08255 [Betaproteobacteria bacterium]